MNVGDYDFELPEALIAQTPLADRTSSRLLVLHKDDGRVEHRSFKELANYLVPGDTLVLNDTKVIPARLFGVKADTGAKAEVLLLKALGEDRWEALVRPGKRLRRGAELHFGAAANSLKPLLSAVVEEEGEMGARVIRFRYEGIFNEILDRLGEMPLPPYIKERLEDRDRYQTVYAVSAGSAAAPTAGLHFTEEYLQELAASGIRICRVTLHVGLGTFRPVSVDNVLDHKMHEEWYGIDGANAELLNRARREGTRIVAVGTTSARTLETLGQRFGDAPIEACSGWTGIFIYPGYDFRLVSALLTNFHLPKSTLVMLVSALAGREHVLAAYREAVAAEYRFFSFGDAMFIT